MSARQKPIGLTDYQVGELQESFKTLNAKVELIMTNHLPHLKEDVTSLKTRINVMTAINIGGIIAGIVVARFLQ